MKRYSYTTTLNRIQVLTINIIVGRSKWRYDVFTLTAEKCDDNGYSVMKITFSCSVDDLTATCEHASLLSTNYSLELKIKSVISREVLPTGNMEEEDSWRLIRIPPVYGDDYALYHVYRRKHLNLMSISNATVSID